MHKRASAAAEMHYLKSLQAGDIAYLWPAVSLQAHRLLHDRGFQIVLEGINTRMSSAKQVLDDAYRQINLPPAHGITEERIAEEEQKLALASAIFAPSPAVERALKGSPLDPGGVISASYGTDIPDWSRSEKDEAGALRVLFVGYACVRKGIHVLLQAWNEARVKGELIIAGAIEPAVRRHCAHLLDDPSVRTLGFIRDVRSLYRSADIFVLPSFEEGDPLVTYEAAAHELPLVVSFHGAGRLGSRGDSVCLIDEHDAASLVHALRGLANDAEMRIDAGRRARSAVEEFRWSAVGARRAQALATCLSLPK
jgi:glycosyltransferase involved in cell wall biosynthesis